MFSPPALTTGQSTQAVSGTTISAESGGAGPGTGDEDTRSVNGLRTLSSIESDDELQHILNGLMEDRSPARGDRRELRDGDPLDHRELAGTELGRELGRDHSEPGRGRENGARASGARDSSHSPSYMDLNIFPGQSYRHGQGSRHGHGQSSDYFSDRIQIHKNLTQSQFYKKLKHFMIFSSAGKPIYTMNGSDDVIMGYTGLITTIISSFEDTVHEQIKTIDMDGLKISLLNRNPVVLVSITKIKYEMALNQNTNEHTVLENQLKALYNYLISIISRPVLKRHFSGRENFDLRRVMTGDDFGNLDRLCVELTYGIPGTGTGASQGQGQNTGASTSQSQGSSGASQSETGASQGETGASQGETGASQGETGASQGQNTAIQESQGQGQASASASSSAFESYISSLLSSFLTIPIPNTTRTKLNTILKQSNPDPDYLFGLLLKDNAIVSLLKPKNYTISPQDFNNLLLIISQQPESELWLPICMPHFNSNGFLYIYVKTYKLLKIVLISTNKNSFYKLQEKAQGIISQLEMENFKRIYKDLDTHVAMINSILPKNMLHFIYKDKTKNQFVSSNLSNMSGIKYVYYYVNVYNSKSSTIKSLIENKNDKKLTYLKFEGEVGFMLSDRKYEFYCVTREMKLVRVIEDALGVVRWCRGNKRLFNSVVEV